MGVIQQAMAVSLFAMTLSFAITMVNVLNEDYLSERGNPLLYSDVTTTINESNIGVSSTQSGQNDSINDIHTFNKPENIDFNFDVTSSINSISVIGQFFYYSTVGIPEMARDSFHMPWYFVAPMIILINLSHILLGIYMYTGRTFT